MARHVTLDVRGMRGGLHRVGQRHVERRGVPVGRGDEVAVLVEQRGGRDAADRFWSVAVDALGLGLVHDLAPGDRLLVEGIDRALLAGRLVEPVQRRGDRDEGQEDEPGPQGAIELAALELLVGEVGLAVGGKLYLRADLGLGPTEGLGVSVYKFFDRIVHEHEIRHQRTSTHQPTLHGTAAKRTISGAGLDTFFYRYGGCDYAGSEESFEAKACDESGTGFGGCRVDFFASGGRIGIGRADSGHSADTEHGTGSRNHPR